MDGLRLLPRTGCAQPSRPAAGSSKSARQEWRPILPHIVSPSAPARGGQAAVSGGMGCCRWLWLRLATLIFPNRTCRSLGTSFASAGLFAPVLDINHDSSTTSRSRVISTHSGEVPLSYRSEERRVGEERRCRGAA